MTPLETLQANRFRTGYYWIRFQDGWKVALLAFGLATDRGVGGGVL
jgi:hypothetical protein